MWEMEEMEETEDRGGDEYHGKIMQNPPLPVPSHPFSQAFIS